MGRSPWKAESLLAVDDGRRWNLHELVLDRGLAGLREDAAEIGVDPDVLVSAALKSLARAALLDPYRDWRCTGCGTIYAKEEERRVLRNSPSCPFCREKAMREGTAEMLAAFAWEDEAAREARSCGIRRPTVHH